MQCGTPVITGNLTSLPEVVGSAGLTVNPFDEEQLTAALGKLIDDENLRAHLHRIGIERAAQFSWQKTAQLTLAVYEQVAEAK